MYSIQNHVIAVCFCVVTMLGWGSWANTLKLSTRCGWPFELYYWDYVVGMCAGCAAIVFTFGSRGNSGTSAIASIAAASGLSILAALVSGVLFNFSNVLIVIATDLAGIAIAFPVAVGLAVVIGTSVTYLQNPAGRAAPLFCGLGLLVLAMLLSTLATQMLTGSVRLRSLRGPVEFFCIDRRPRLQNVSQPTVNIRNPMLAIVITVQTEKILFHLLRENKLTRLAFNF